MFWLDSTQAISLANTIEKRFKSVNGLCSAQRYRDACFVRLIGFCITEKKFFLTMSIISNAQNSLGDLHTCMETSQKK